MAEPRIILGIDPGLGRTGYGCVQSVGMELTTVAFGCVTTEPHTPIGERLLTLERDLNQLFETFKPDRVVVEELVFVENVTTGIAVGEARGVILLVAARYGVPIIELAPTQVKLGVTGYGHAEKAQVQDMVCRILKLETRPAPDDAADALALAICGAGMREE